MNRKNFLKSSALSLAAVTLAPVKLLTSPFDGTEPLKAELVKEFVGAGHKDLDKVKQMLAEYPNLIYSRYDWGNGDFEEAIEGAGHVGDEDIANYLIEQGARVNLFVLTMLGKTELVKPVLDQYPALVNAKGAHGFTLLHHAERGGDKAKELYDYVQSKGLTEKQIKIK